MANKKAAPLRVQTDYGEVALAPKSGKYWHLNSTAAQILDELQTGATPGALRMLLWPHTGSVPSRPHVMSLRPSHHFTVRVSSDDPPPSPPGESPGQGWPRHPASVQGPLRTAGPAALNRPS